MTRSVIGEIIANPKKLLDLFQVSDPSIMVIDFKYKPCDFYQLIDLIHSFPLSFIFLQWISRGDLDIQVTYAQKQNKILERLAEISIHGLEVYSTGGEIFLDRVSKDFANRVAVNEKEYYGLIPELARLNKKMISSSLVDSTYTTISEFISSHHVCGCIWEIYHLDRLLEIYKKTSMKSIDASKIVPFQSF